MPRILLVLVLCLVAINALGEEYHVPEDFESIQDAITNADHGDLIVVHPGRYVESIDFLGKNLTVTSLYYFVPNVNYIMETIIDGGGEARCVRFANRETEDAKLLGLTLENGAASYGAGVYVSEASPYIANVIIRECIASQYGGGVYATNASEPFLEKVTISQNGADVGRGGLHFFNNSEITLHSCIVWDNNPAALSNGMLIAYSIVQGGYGGQGNVDSNPLFVNAGLGNFRLQEDSPAIDAGYQNSPNDPDDSRADMGAVYYHQGPYIGINPFELEFGGVSIGRNRVFQLSVLNNGNQNLSIQSVQVLDNNQHFSITQGGGAGIVAAGNSRIVSIRFQPRNEGELNGVVRITSNDFIFPLLDVQLTGTGLPAVPVLRYEPSFFEFEETNLYRATSQSITISNVGEAVLTIENMTIIQEFENYLVNFDNPRDIEVNGFAEFELSFAPITFGHHLDTLLIQTNDPENEFVQIPLEGNALMPVRQYNFASNTSVDHSILVIEASINDEELPYGSEIGVFTPAGLCAGGEYWRGGRTGFPAWGDNVVTDDIDGFEDNEQITFRLWDPINMEEYIVEPELIEGDDVFSENGVTICNLHALTEVLPSFTLRLVSGWNMVSLPITPEDNNVIRMWTPIVQRERIGLIKDHFGRFYMPAIGFSNIPFWNHLYGYQVKVEGEADTLRVVGEFTDPETAILVERGWSLIAYLPERNVLAPTALTGIQDNLEIAKDGFGNFYIPEFGFNNIPPMHRGQGYQLKVTDDIELIWNVPNQMAGIEESFEPFRQHKSKFEVKRTRENMSLLVFSNEKYEGAEVLIYSDNGQLIGASAIDSRGKAGVAIWGKDNENDEMHGALNSEQFVIKLVLDQVEMKFEEIWHKGSANYSSNDWAVVQLELEDMLPLTSEIVSISPNPFNSSSRIDFRIPSQGLVSVEVYDLTGKLVKNLANGQFNAGLHTVSFEGGELPSGIYWVKLKSASETSVRKVALIR